MNGEESRKLNFPALEGARLAANALPGVLLPAGNDIADVPGGAAIENNVSAIIVADFGESGGRDAGSGASLENAFPSGVPVFRISLAGESLDWLDGYGKVIGAVCGALPGNPGNTDPEGAAIVGYMMDRNEGDHEGNLDELRRILGDGLGLRLAGVAAGGAAYRDNGLLKSAGIIVSLPYGREAAAALAAATGARLVETGIPFGIDATVKWIREIGEAAGTRERAEVFIDRELERIIPRIERVVHRCFMGRRIAYCGDPFLMEGLKGMVEEMGGSFRAPAVFSRDRRPAGREGRDETGPAGICYEPRRDVFRDILIESEGETGTDLFVSNSVAAGLIREIAGGNAPLVNFGYPSHEYHELRRTPFLGFAGAAAFISRMANEILAGES